MTTVAQLRSTLGRCMSSRRYEKAANECGFGLLVQQRTYQPTRHSSALPVRQLAQCVTEWQTHDARLTFEQPAINVNGLSLCFFDRPAFDCAMQFSAALVEPHVFDAVTAGAAITQNKDR